MSTGPGTGWRRPEFAVAAFGLAALLAVTGALAYARERTEAHHRAMVAIQSDIGAPLAQLQSAAAQFEASQVTFDGGVHAPTSAEAGALFATALSQSAQAKQYWEDFSTNRLALDGEEDARRAIDDAIAADSAAGEALGVAVLDPGADPAVVASLEATQTGTHAQLHSALTHLERDLYQEALLQQLDDATSQAQATSDALRTAALALGAIGVGVIALGYRRASRRTSAELAKQAAQDLIAHENALDADLQHALDMTDEEAQVFEVVERALAVNHAEHLACFLLADTAVSRFSSVVTTDDSGIRCEVPTPQQCPVTRSGRESVFVTSDALDACTHLRAHGAAPCSAACIPVSIAGRAVGVIHECHANNDPPQDHRVHELKIIARKAGERLSVLRALEQSHLQAHTDPLTGLLNRRSLDEAAARLSRDDVPYSIAFADLDHFKALNDTYGHDVGDRALRLFATVLRTSVRPADVVARFGGEEFVVVLPSCTATEAVTVLGRVQRTLADTLRTESTPAFTVSIGIAVADAVDAFNDVLTLADGCLLRAKEGGRDRIVVAGDVDG